MTSSPYRFDAFADLCSLICVFSFVIWLVSSGRSRSSRDGGRSVLEDVLLPVAGIASSTGSDGVLGAGAPVADDDALGPVGREGLARLERMLGGVDPGVAELFVTGDRVVSVCEHGSRS